MTAVREDPGGHPDDQVPLDHLDALVEGLLVVAVEHRDGLLREDRAGVGARVDQVHRAAGDPDAVGERVPHGVRAGERRQQGGVGVEDPLREGLEDRRAEDPHEPGAHQPVRAQLLQPGGEGRVPGGPAVVVAGPDDDRAAPRGRPRASTAGQSRSVTRATSSAGTSPAATASASRAKRLPVPGGEHDESGHAGQGRAVWDDAPVADQARGTTRRALDEPHARLTVEMALLLLGAQLTRGLDLPWRVAGVVFSVLALVQGVRALAALRRHRRRAPGRAGHGPGGRRAAGARAWPSRGALTVLQLVLLAAWPVVAERDSCRDRALTRTAAQECDDALMERLEQQLGGLGG